MEKILENMKRHRRNLHQIPELGYEEKKTQAYLLQEIKKMGYEPKIICETGIYVYVDGGAEETYGFRTDIDGLSILEETGVSYSSKHEGSMHACGHDGHMATLLGFMEYLRGKKIKKNILAVFQPAEEGPGGAKNIVESGILEKYNVQGIFGLHLFPKLEEGIIGCRPGGFMAKAAEDFGFYQEVIRGLFFFVGTKNEKLGYVESLHNSKFNFDEKVLENGLRVYTGLCKKLEILE